MVWNRIKVLLFTIAAVVVVLLVIRGFMNGWKLNMLLVLAGAAVLAGIASAIPFRSKNAVPSQDREL